MSHEGGHRHQRLEQLIGEELASLLRYEAQDPLLDDVRITEVTLSIDYKSARVLWIGIDESKLALTKPQLAKIDGAFERAAPFLRARLGHALDLKRLPSLSFMYDRDAAARTRAAAVVLEDKARHEATKPEEPPAQLDEAPLDEAPAQLDEDGAKSE